ncbi:hypothetical protein ET495_01570 [Xylanimonas allomyrinae]|uniref:Type VII secretion integral membrane protein EccD n=1 Tax=Xylanimonas allomyrinae TaxID=2509459 RepID=A0A4P6EHZ9_9MICO|nr:hypothetical protein [Xylanimonas allomyrinae]QAY62180.1 hypothetical protein ET495_01570 [Xylanimonas allomyrinae]
MVTAPAVRRVALLDGAQRIDLAIPLTSTVGDALAQAGVDGRSADVVLIGSAAGIGPHTRVADLADGALVTVLHPDRGHPRGTPAPAPVPSRATTERVGRWGLVAASVLVVGVVLLLGHGRHGAGATHLAVLTASAAVGAVAIAGTVVAGLHTRATLAATGAWASALAGVWGLGLGLAWDARLCAALTVAAVPLAVRALPGLVLRLPDELLLDSPRFMETRWSVRMPEVTDPGAVDGQAISARVLAARQARSSATALLAATGAAALPAAVGTRPGQGLVLVGQVALLLCYAAATSLLGRASTSAVQRWALRATAAVPCALGVALTLNVAERRLDPAVAAALLGVGVATALVAPAIARGARSLVLSRAADIAEALVIALALPAGLLAGGAVQVARAVAA